MARDKCNDYIEETKRTCERDIQKAHERNLEEPDFDFRSEYAAGQTIYYLFVNTYYGEKTIVKLKISTVYPRTVIAFEEKGRSWCIGYPDRDLIFADAKSAQRCYEEIDIKERFPETEAMENEA